MGFCGVEFPAEVGGDLIVRGVGVAVEFDAQCVGSEIGAQVDGGLEQSAHEAACVVVTGEGFAREVDQCGLGAIGDEFDGIDELLAPDSELGDALIFRQGFEFDVLWDGFALGFEFVEVSLGLHQRSELPAFE